MKSKLLTFFSVGMILNLSFLYADKDVDLEVLASSLIESNKALSAVVEEELRGNTPDLQRIELAVSTAFSSWNLFQTSVEKVDDMKGSGLGWRVAGISVGVAGPIAGFIYLMSTLKVEKSIMIGGAGILAGVGLYLYGEFGHDDEKAQLQEQLKKEVDQAIQMFDKMCKIRGVLSKNEVNLSSPSLETFASESCEKLETLKTEWEKENS